MKVFIVLATLTGLALSGKPLGGYGAPALGGYGSPSHSTFGGAAPLGAYGPPIFATALGDVNVDGASRDESPILGVPGSDYPIYNEVPETSFSCEGKVEGGYYADSEARCQAFHICAADGEGGLLKKSSLCHNGTIFNQEIFTCDLWSNFNCADAEGLYFKNEELAAAREEAALAAAATGGYGAPSVPAVSGAATVVSGVYGVPVAPPVAASVAGGYGAPVAVSASAQGSVVATSGYGAPVADSNTFGSQVASAGSVQGSTASGYGAPVAAGSGYGAPVAAGSGYGAPISSYSV